MNLWGNLKKLTIYITIAVNKGFSRQPSTTESIFNSRQLKPTQSAPTLSFYKEPVHSFRSNNEIFESVMRSGGSTGKRANELQPMYETSPSSSRGGSFNGGFSRNSTGGMGDGDGFDLDEAFGAARGVGFNRLPLSYGGDTIEESQGSTTTTGTITTGLKRAFEDESGTGIDPNDDDDDDMEGGHTDIEEEEGEEVQDMAVFNMPIGRPLAGRRPLSKTHSLPTHLFSDSSMF